MKAWRFYAIGDMRLDEIPTPHPRPGWVTIRTRVVQPSVTEAIRARGGSTRGSDYIKKVIAERSPVQLLGHEFCGDVVELGEGVTSVKEGDRASARSNAPCHNCHWCRTGQEERCWKGPLIGQSIPGGLCEYFVVPVEALSIVPPGVSDNEAACLQPLACCVATVERTRIQIGDTVAILGMGVMGLSILQLARAAGARLIIGVDVRKSCLRMGKDLGADYQLDATEADPVQAVLDLTHGMGVDVVFECAGGSPAEGLAGTKTLGQAVSMVGHMGKIVQVAVIGEPIEIDPILFRTMSLSYIFSPHTTASLMDYAVRLVAGGVVKAAPMITHVLRGLENVPKSFEITANKVAYDAVNPAQVVVFP